MNFRNGITKLQSIILVAIIVVAAASIAFYYWFKTSTGPTGLKIRVGLIFPLTGAQAPLGQESYIGTKLAIDIINELGGVLGKYKIDYVVADARSDPSVGAAEAERLITVENIKIIMGFYASPIALAVSEVCEKYKAICWSMGEVSDEITLRGYKYTFRCIEMGSELGSIMAVPFVAEVCAPKLGVKPNELRAVIIHEDGPYGTSCAAGDVFMCQKYGINVVLKEAYSSKATDLSSLILKVIAAKPDVIFITSYTSDAILFFKQAKELGLKVKIFIGHGGGHGVADTANAVGDDINYIFSAGNSPAAAINPKSLTTEANQLRELFVNKYRSQFGRDPLTHATLFFSYAIGFFKYVLPIAIQKYGSVDPESIIKAAEEVNVPRGGLPNGAGLKFSTEKEPFIDPSGKKHIHHNILGIYGASVQQWFNRNLYIVWPKDVATRDPVIPLPPTSPYAAPS